MKRFEGRTVLVTGAARGQGRSHALHFAREGADLAICDICANIDTVPYPLSGEAELAETEKLCVAEGASVLSERLDVRSWQEVESFVAKAVERFGKIDVAVANAGIFGHQPIAEMDPQRFADMIDVNLRGVFHTIRAVLPSMRQRKYGRIVATGSVCSLIGFPNVGHYVAAKHGVAGLIKTVAKEVGAEGITANYVVPNGVGTDMIRNRPTYELVSPEDPTEEAAMPIWAAMNAIPKPWVQPEDVSKVVLFLASDDAAYTTGSGLKVDLGATA